MILIKDKLIVVNLIDTYINKFVIDLKLERKI